jgi:DNA-binding NtrC family response regulator
MTLFPRPADRPLLAFHLDDDIFEREHIKTSLESNTLGVPFKLESFATVASLKERLRRAPEPDLVILDLQIDATELAGIAVARACRERFPQVPILIRSTIDDAQTVSQCIQAGADDFISKTSDKGETCLRVASTLRLINQRRGIFAPSDAEEHSRRPIGKTMESVSARVPLINSAVSAIHISGASGTGKEVVADLFAASLPKNTPFIRVNCGAIAPSLLQSELFGYAKGAFTGALAPKTGLLEGAHGGWIFLDEVATLTSEAQVALLRALENHEIIRVGDTQPRKVQVRVLSATNESLAELSASGKFRKDLWQRLCETTIELPPLAARTDEIAPLVHHFCRTMAGGPYTITQPTLDILCQLPWKDGNIRELRNCLRAMTEMHVNKQLTPLSLPERLWDTLAMPSPPPSEAPLAQDDDTPTLRAGRLTVGLIEGAPLVYERLCGTLLVELIRMVVAEQGPQSLRSLSKTIHLSRSTLSGRLKDLVREQIVSMEELEKLVGISES